jgi:hypothetical protein
MSNEGTLSEQRKLNNLEPTVTTKAPVVKMVETTKIIEKPILATLTKPEVIEDKKPQHVADTKCMYCKVQAVVTLSCRGAFILVLLALCYNLIKTAK